MIAAACGTPSPSEEEEPLPADAVVVTSFNFDESVLLAEVYAQALEHFGYTVRRELRLGTRELVVPALQQGLVDLVPEYLGSGLSGLDPGTDVDRRDPGAVRRALERAARSWSLEILRPAPAQNHNVLAVTRDVAREHGLQAVSDLQGLAADLRIGGPAECPERPFCIPGLEEVYGLQFSSFVAVDGSARVVRALEEGVVDVGVLFSTDGVLAQPGLVALDDDRGLNPAENIVPVLRSEVARRHGPGMREVLDDVSDRLTTPMLRFLNWRVTVAGHDAASEARGWLIRQGVIDVP